MKIFNGEFSVGLAAICVVVLTATLTHAQVVTVTLEVEGIVDFSDQGFFPEVQVGDPYSATFAVEIQPGPQSDESADPDVGYWTGPVTFELSAGPMTLANRELVINGPGGILTRNNTGSDVDSIRCDLNLFRNDVDGVLQELYDIELFQDDDNLTRLEADKFPSEQTLNDSAVAAPNMGMVVKNKYDFNLPGGDPVLLGYHTSARWTITWPTPDPLECLTLTVTGEVSSVDQSFYTNVNVGDLYFANYAIEYSPNQDLDFDLTLGEWIGDNALDLTFPNHTIAVPQQPGNMIVGDNIDGLYDLGQLNADNGSELVSLSFLDLFDLNGLPTNLSSDDAPTESQWNSFPLGQTSSEFSVYATPDLSIRQIGGRHTAATFTITPGPCFATCHPDTNGDGILDNGDIGAFVALFLAGDLAADFTGDGILDNGDIGAFVAAFLAGC